MISLSQHFEGDIMGYVFIVFTENSRDFALHVRSHLEADRISTWLRDLNHETQSDRALSYTALRAASAVLLVSQKNSDDSMPAIAQLQQELSKSNAPGLPLLVLRDPQDLPAIMAQLHEIAPLQEGGSPLPIPSSDPLTPLSGMDAQTPQNRLLLVFLVVGLGMIVFIGMLMLSQMPSGPLTSPSVTPRTITLSPTDLR
jgi:hypothetical protein